MDQQQFLAERFEADRPRLRAVAYRMLGSLSDCDDALQEAWLRLSRSGASGVDNLAGWLTTVVARVCLDVLRARKSRREDPLDAHTPEPVAHDDRLDAEQEEELAASVGLALLVVLETLAPPERLAFVLHDMFGVSFNEIAPMVGRSPAAARQLASRARRRVQGKGAVGKSDPADQREVVAAFLAAARDGNFDALLALLDPDVVLRADAAAAPGGSREVRGALSVARGALAFAARAQSAELALVDGTAGLVVAPRGRLFAVLAFNTRRGKVAAIDVIADRSRLRRVDLAILDR